MIKKLKKLKEEYQKNGFPCDECFINPASCGKECLSKNQSWKIESIIEKGEN